MYTLYFTSTLCIFSYLYFKIKRLFTIKNNTFDDLKLNYEDTMLDSIVIIYEDYTKDFIEDLNNFEFILHLYNKSIKYVTINYSIIDQQHSILFNNNNLEFLCKLKFPFYNNIVNMPLYREVKKAILLINEIEYDITELLLKFAGPKLNYHSDLVSLRFEEIIEYSQEFPELLNVTGIINIDDNFDDKHVYHYPGEFTWKENLLD